VCCVQAMLHPMLVVQFAFRLVSHGTYVCKLKKVWGMVESLIGWTSLSNLLVLSRDTPFGMIDSLKFE